MRKNDPATLSRIRLTLPHCRVSMSDGTLRLMQTGEVKDEDHEEAPANNITSESQRERPNNQRQRVRALQTHDPSCGRIKMDDVEEVKSEDEDLYNVKC